MKVANFFIGETTAVMLPETTGPQVNEITSPAPAAQISAPPVHTGRPHILAHRKNRAARRLSR